MRISRAERQLPTLARFQPAAAAGGSIMRVCNFVLVFFCLFLFFARISDST